MYVTHTSVNVIIGDAIVCCILMHGSRSFNDINDVKTKKILRFKTCHPIAGCHTTRKFLNLILNNQDLCSDFKNTPPFVVLGRSPIIKKAIASGCSFMVTKVITRNISGFMKWWLDYTRCTGKNYSWTIKQNIQHNHTVELHEHACSFIYSSHMYCYSSPCASFVGEVICYCSGSIMIFHHCFVVLDRQA